MSKRVQKLRYSNTINKKKTKKYITDSLQKKISWFAKSSRYDVLLPCPLPNPGQYAVQLRLLKLASQRSDNGVSTGLSFVCYNIYKYRTLTRRLEGDLSTLYQRWLNSDWRQGRTWNLQPWIITMYCDLCCASKSIFFITQTVISEISGRYEMHNLACSVQTSCLSIYIQYVGAVFFARTRISNLTANFRIEIRLEYDLLSHNFEFIRALVGCFHTFPGDKSVVPITLFPISNCFLSFKISNYFRSPI